MKPKTNKPKTIKIYTAIDTAQSSFIRPAKKKQLKLAKKTRIKITP